MEMPKVMECEALDCAYNKDRRCHALAINVTTGPHARCDTYWTAAGKGGDEQAQGKVGACQATECRHNQRLVCTAPGIKVGRANGLQIDCLTFHAREPVMA
jgi:hypothetical protein